MSLRTAAVVLTCMLLLAGCGAGTSGGAPTTTKAHEQKWLGKHDGDAHASMTECYVCHGTNLEGNGQIPACRTCHSYGGPPFFVHPPLREPGLGWAHPSNHGSYAKENIKGCQGCHGGWEEGPGSNLRFTRQLGDLELGCESALGCHNNNDQVNSFQNGHNPKVAHPSYDPAVPAKQDRKHWYGENIVYRTTPGGLLKNYPLNHATAGNVMAACSVCHGAHLNGPVEGGVGPGCMDCHVLDPVANPSRCVSCHGPLPGQQSAPQHPSQFARQAGRLDLLAKRTFVNFTSQLITRMQRDPSRVKIEPLQAGSKYYYMPSAYVSYTTATSLGRRSSHLHHDTLACSERQNNATCSGCHKANAGSAGNMSRHHSLMATRGLGCANCHEFTFGSNGFSLGNFRNCSDCHGENFCK